MGRLAIRKVVYKGDNYHFESPNLGDGLNIVVGSNGNGKTTFMNLIYYALGGSVPEFNKSNENENKHKEIFYDENNYVRLVIQINDSNYILTRYFAENYIFITDIDGNENETFRVNRHEGCEIFSDWLLNKLGINVFEIYQGTKKWKINFMDLMRLFYYDQKTQIDRIYKELQYDNFLSDSEMFRKAIFEILIGKTYNEYYESLAKYNNKLKEKLAKKDALQIFKSFRDEILKEETINIVYLKEMKDKCEDDLKKYEILREDARNFTNTPQDVVEDIEVMRTKLLQADHNYNSITEELNQRHKELKNFTFLFQDLKNEIQQIEKIKYLHNRLSLFSPDTCPYCLKDVQRSEGKCICGSDIDEAEYEKFFYTEDEYLDMILSKKKSLESLDFAINSCNEDIENINAKLRELLLEKKSIKESITNLSREMNSSYNSEKVRQLDNKIVKIKESLSKINQNIEIETKREKLDKELEQIEKDLEILENATNEYELEARKDIFEKRNLFSEIYKEYLMNVDKNCTSARINTEYMPVINNGEYRESSASVHKRLMYFFTLLNIAIRKNGTNHPRVLLIDTPNKEGIDPENLIRSLQQVKTFFENDKSTEFQIIMTTGYDTYPEQFEEHVVIQLTDYDKLLKAVEKQKK
jgi:DNA repair exonuclease SbcCD ATPase subunit